MCDSGRNWSFRVILAIAIQMWLAPLTTPTKPPQPKYSSKFRNANVLYKHELRLLHFFKPSLDCSVGTSKRRIMSTTQLVDFLNKTQRDPRLNEILYPYANPARAKDLIQVCTDRESREPSWHTFFISAQEYEPNKFNAQKGLLSFDGFLRYVFAISSAWCTQCQVLRLPRHANWYVRVSQSRLLSANFIFCIRFR